MKTIISGGSTHRKALCDKFGKKVIVNEIEFDSIGLAVDYIISNLDKEVKRDTIRKYVRRILSSLNGSGTLYSKFNISKG